MANPIREEMTVTGGGMVRVATEVTTQAATADDLPIPEYHEDILIVKVRDQAEAPLAGLLESGAGVTAFDATELSTFPGLQMLSHLEKAGLIRRVVSLSEGVPEAVERSRNNFFPAMTIMAAAMEDVAQEPGREKNNPNAGVNLVHLESAVNLPQVQLMLAQDPSIEYAARVPLRYIAVTAPEVVTAPENGATIAAVPPPAPTMWNLAKIRWEQARQLPDFDQAAAIRVGILDTGIDEDHPDLQGRITQYIWNHPDSPGVSSTKDLIGHGTHVAGTIGAKINNAVGINGICESQLWAWKIFDDTPDRFGSTFVYYVNPEMYRRALADCLDAEIDVINLSIGGTAPPDPNEASLFQELIGNGTAVVAAMGNARQKGSPVSYPAAIPGVIAVGATNLDDTVANFSNRGNHISLCAPGVAIWSTVPTYPGQQGFASAVGTNGTLVPDLNKPVRRETDYDAWAGTSMATPHVSAAIALLLARRGKMNPQDVKQSLMDSADRLPAMQGDTFTPDYGAGRLNLLNLLSH